MTSVGLPVTVKQPRVTPEDKPSWETVLAPDDHQAWLLDGAQTDLVLVTPGTGRRLLLTGIVLSIDGDSGGSFTFSDSTGWVIIGPLWFAAQMALTLPMVFVNGIILEVGEPIRVTTTFTDEHSVQLTWKEF